MNSTLEKLLETAIPVSKAQFHSAVNNADQVPENYFSNDSGVASRRAQMWSIPGELIVCQKNLKKEDRYFAVPKSNIIFYNITTDEPLVAQTPKRGRPFKTET